MFYRKLHEYLLDWKSRNNRKPLIIRGARQVGKSTLVNEFGREFRYFISLNLEKYEDKLIFEKLNLTKDIVESVFLRSGMPLTKEPTLVFIDEIQESAKAILQLRYIAEEYPGIHVIAAGSLFEFALSKLNSFPVGRVEQVVLHPLDFDEFLLALGREDLVNELASIPPRKAAFKPLLDLFNDYTIIGGMPEIVKCFSEEKSMTNLGRIYSNLWQSYRDDTEKYASNSTERKIIRHIIDTAATEKDRISLAGFGYSGYRSREVGEAMRSLDMARIIRMIYPSTNLAPPAIPDIRRSPRLQFLDTGLLNYAMGHQAQMIGINDMNDFCRGKIVNHITLQQVQANNWSPLYRPMFWVREKANSNAEIDLILPHGKYLLPVEIKSGSHGTLRSLHQYIERCDHNYAIRLLANNFSVEKLTTPGGKPYILMNTPYFVSSRIDKYLSWLTENY